MVDERTVDHDGPATRELGVECLGIVNPEEGVPGAALTLDRTDQFGAATRRSMIARPSRVQMANCGGSPTKYSIANP